MTTQTFAGTTLHVNDEGFLLDAGAWTPAVAEGIAAELGITLTPKHWEAINFAREDFASKGQSPGLRRITTGTTVTMKEIYELFPRGPGKLVARIAGLPKPKSCL